MHNGRFGKRKCVSLVLLKPVSCWHFQVLLERVFCIVQLVCEVILLLEHAITISPILLLRNYNKFCGEEQKETEDDEPIADQHSRGATGLSKEVFMAHAKRPDSLLLLLRLVLRDRGLLWRAAATFVTGFVAGRCAWSDGLQQLWEPVLLIFLLCNGLRQSRTVDMIRFVCVRVRMHNSANGGSCWLNHAAPSISYWAGRMAERTLQLTNYPTQHPQSTSAYPTQRPQFWYCWVGAPKNFRERRGP